MKFDLHLLCLNTSSVVPWSSNIPDSCDGRSVGQRDVRRRRVNRTSLILRIRHRVRHRRGHTSRLRRVVRRWRFPTHIRMNRRCGDRGGVLCGGVGVGLVIGDRRCVRRSHLRRLVRSVSYDTRSGVSGSVGGSRCCWDNSGLLSYVSCSSLSSGGGCIGRLVVGKDYGLSFIKGKGGMLIFGILR